MTDERERAERLEVEKKTYESGWLEAEGKISDLNEKLKKTESQCEALRQAVCDAMTQLRWLNEKEQRGSTNTILARLEATLNESKD